MKRSPIRRKARLRSTRDRTPDEWSYYEQQAETVRRRSGGRCEAMFAPTCSGRAGARPHHVLRQRDGGLDTAENLLDVCPDCHARIHNRKLDAASRGLLVLPW